jgi:zinc transporter 7
MGIAIHNATTAEGVESIDLASGIRQSASGMLGTTAYLGDLVRLS